MIPRTRTGVAGAAGFVCLFSLVWLASGGISQPADRKPLRHMEHLGRGVVAIHQGDGKVYVGWRLLGTDPDEIAFNLYRTAGDG